MIGLNADSFVGQIIPWTSDPTDQRVGYIENEIGMAAGLARGTRIATMFGWRGIESVAAGDMVLTFDNGLQPVEEISTGRLWTGSADCPRNLWPLEVPAGVLGNDGRQILLPEQAVLVESDAADEFFGDPFALISVADLEGYRGIERVFPEEELQAYTLHFAEDQVIFVQDSLLAFCPDVASSHVTGLLTEKADSIYRTLSTEEAGMLVRALIAEKG